MNNVLVWWACKRPNLSENQIFFYPWELYARKRNILRTLYSSRATDNHYLDLDYSVILHMTKTSSYNCLMAAVTSGGIQSVYLFFYNNFLYSSNEKTSWIVISQDVWGINFRCQAIWFRRPYSHEAKSTHIPTFHAGSPALGAKYVVFL